MSYSPEDRPSDESHEVVYFPAAKHAPGSTVRCTYIDIPQAATSVVHAMPQSLWSFASRVGHASGSSRGEA
jgi:secernin